MKKRIEKIMKFDSVTKYFTRQGTNIYTSDIIVKEILYNLDNVISEMSDEAILELVDASLVTLKKDGVFSEQPLRTFCKNLKGALK